jgi:hypothetical protein
MSTQLETSNNSNNTFPCSQVTNYKNTATLPKPSASASIDIHRPSTETDHAELLLLWLLLELELLLLVFVPLTTVFVPGSPYTFTEPMSKYAVP